VYLKAAAFVRRLFFNAPPPYEPSPDHRTARCRLHAPATGAGYHAPELEAGPVLQLSDEALQYGLQMLQKTGLNWRAQARHMHCSRSAVCSEKRLVSDTA
jgi:hypothetical protein